MDAAELRARYEREGLDRADLDPDPVRVFEAWFAAARAADLWDPHAMVLATVGENGRPSTRNVLMKGIDERGLVFVTNFASVKGRHLAANPHASVTFSWNQIRRQVTVSGVATRLPDEESDAEFAARPRGSQLSAWASDQSEPIPDRAHLEDRYAELEARFEGGDVPRPDFWGGYRLTPHEWIFWQGRPDRLHDRFRYERSDEGWTITRLAP